MDKEKSTDKTTKQILQERLAGEKRTPLYSTQAIEKLRERFDQWKNDVVSEGDRKNWHVTPQSLLGSEIPRELIYTPLNIPDFDYEKDLGNSGEEPFTRGVHPNMYRGRLFTERQLTGFGKPEDTNARMKFLLEHGMTGLDILFDMPTIQMYDSDDPRARGQVGSCGVCVDSVEDWEKLFDGMDIVKESASIVTHYPSNTAILFPMYLVMAEHRNISWDQLRGSSQNDTTMESLVRNAAEYIPPEDTFRIQCDNIEYIRENVPRWNFITLNGYNLREFGTSGTTEMAVAVSNGIATLEEMISRGHDVDWIAGRLAFFWSPAMDFFEEICRIRAVRRLWYKIMKYKFDAKNPRSMWMRCHCQTSGISLVREEPLNNIIRGAFEALAAVLGGTQSLHVDSYDEAIAIPSEEAALLSLRTQQIINQESGVTQVVDPLAGSYYVEALTNDIEQRILNELTEIEEHGGYVEVIKSGFLQNKISEHFYHEQKKLEDGEIKVVAHNFDRSAEAQDFEAFRYPEDAERVQLERLRKLKETRDNAKVEQALNALKDACKKKVNIVPYTVDCAKASCTVGEQWKVFKEAFGLWTRPSFF